MLAMLRIIMQYSLVKLVVDGTAAQKIDNQLAKRSFPVLNWNIDGSSTTFAKNDNCVPHRLCDQPKKNENNLKEYWTQLTLRMRETTRTRSPIGFLIFYHPYFPRNPCFSLNKLALQFFLKRNLSRKIQKAETLLVSWLNKKHDWQGTAKI